MTAPAFIIVSQSHTLARGLCEVVAAMAPDVTLHPCGCHDEGLATATEIISDAIDKVREDAGQACPLVLMADFGSARLAAQQVVAGRDDRTIVLGRGPFVEGTSAGVVAAQQGEDLGAVIRSIAGAAQFFAVGEDDLLEAVATSRRDDPLAPRTVAVAHPEGLSARPAAVIARMASEYDAVITVNDVPATSVLALMGLGVVEGDSVTIAAEGPEADIALETLASAVENGIDTYSMPRPMDPVREPADDAAPESPAPEEPPAQHDAGIPAAHDAGIPVQHDDSRPAENQPSANGQPAPPVPAVTPGPPPTAPTPAAADVRAADDAPAIPAPPVPQPPSAPPDTQRP